MNNHRISLFGEVLVDVFPDGSQVLGGAPFNVAWHLQAFAQHPQFISRVGADDLGRKIISAMQDWQMDVSALQIDQYHPSGVVQVSIKNGNAGYHILPGQAYDFIEDQKISASTRHNLLYHGSLALRHKVSQQSLLAIKSRHQGQLFVDVNLREPWWQVDDVLSMLQGAHWVKMNHEEFALLSGKDAGEICNLQNFMAQHKLGCLLVTLGEHGALAVNGQGQVESVRPGQSLPVIDTVGAGDAFSAVVLLGIHLAWDLPVIMQRAQLFASAMVGQRGAIVQDVGFYQPFKHAWLGAEQV